MIVGQRTDAQGRYVPFANVGDPANLRSSNPVAQPAGGLGGGLSDVGCVSSTFCVAVGGYQWHGAPRSLIERWNGTSWQVQPDALTDHRLNAVSCPSVSFCVATASDQPLIETWNGQAWTAAYTGPDQAELSSVECRSASSCVAVGSAPDASTPFVHPLAVTWNGSNWTGQAAANPSSSQTSDLFGIACVSTGCTAVGYTYTGGPNGKPVTLVERWSGTAWSIVASPTPTSGGRLYSISCVSPSNCTAVGNQVPADDLLVETWNGATWTISAAPNPNPPASSSSHQVSCLADGSCLAVNTLNGLGYVARRTTTWRRLQAADGVGAGYAALASVSCAGSFCAAVGGAENQALVEVRQGGRWSAGSAALGGPPTASELHAVSCAGAGFCVAIGSSTSTEGGSASQVSDVWDGVGWSPILIPPLAGHSTYLQSVACPVVDDCYAAGEATDLATNAVAPLVEHFDGQLWHVMTAPPTSGNAQLSAISCASATFCVVTGSEQNSQGGTAFLADGNGASWSTPFDVPAARLASVACPSAAFCMAVGVTFAGDGAPLSETFDGATWTAQPLSFGGSTVNLSQVACVGASDCLVMDDVPGAVPGSLVEHAEQWNGSVWGPAPAPVAPPAGDSFRLPAVTAAGPGYVAGGLAAADLSRPLVEAYA